MALRNGESGRCNTAIFWMPSESKVNYSGSKLWSYPYKRRAPEVELLYRVFRAHFSVEGWQSSRLNDEIARAGSWQFDSQQNMHTVSAQVDNRQNMHTVSAQADNQQNMHTVCPKRLSV